MEGSDQLDYAWKYLKSLISQIMPENFNTCYLYKKNLKIIIYGW